MIPLPSSSSSGSTTGSREILESSRDPKSALYIAKSPAAVASSGGGGGVKPKVVEARSYSPFKGGKALPPSQSQSSPAPPSTAVSAVTKAAAPATATAPTSAPVPFYLKPIESETKDFSTKYTWSPHSITLIDG